MTEQTPVGVPTCYRHPDRETYVRCQRCEKPICPDCMRDAAVGFQCPDCVKLGAKTTRQAQAAYGGRRSADPRVTTYVLIGLNALVWLAIVVTGWAKSTLDSRLALLPTGECGSKSAPDRSYNLATEYACHLQTRIKGDGQWFPGVSDGAYWQLVTSMFTHVEVLHIAANMLALWFLGPQLEAVLGRARYLALYLVSGLAGSVCVYWFSAEGSATLGASGAIFGMLGGLLVVAHKVGGNVQSIMIWIGVNAVITVTVPNVSWQGHLGGFLGGALVTAILVYAPKGRRTQLQVVGIAVIVVALTAATIARTAVLA
jgi:membrane associated rhomboid family serine protease